MLHGAAGTRARSSRGTATGAHRGAGGRGRRMRDRVPHGNPYRARHRTRRRPRARDAGPVLQGIRLRHARARLVSGRCDHARGVIDEEILRRPIGWWLKEADARLDAAFDSSLSAEGIDRRAWQVLATLARSPTPRADVVASLASFDDPRTVEGVIDRLEQRGWLEESGGALRADAHRRRRASDSRAVGRECSAAGRGRAARGGLRCAGPAACATRGWPA
jgi:hypothetical protein